MAFLGRHLEFNPSDTEGHDQLLAQGRLLLSSNAFVYAVLWISLLRPYPNLLVGSSFGINRVLDLLTLALVLFFFVSRMALDGRLVFPRGLALPMLVFAALSALLPLAYWNSVVLHDEPTGMRDPFELLRFPIMLMVLFFLAQARVDDANIERFIENGYIIPFWIVVLLCVTEIMGVPGISDMKRVLWGQSKNTIAFAVKYFRISGTLENPNWFSLYLNMILALFLFFRRKNLTTVLGILVCTCLIALTGSLTGMVGLLFIVVGYLALATLTVVHRPRTGLLHLVFLAAFIFAGSYIVRHIDNVRVVRSLRLIESKGVLGIESANMRASQARTLIGKYGDDPRLLGFGPSKYFLADVIDNQYVEYLVRYGIIGLCLLLMSYGYYCVAALRLGSKGRSRAIKDYSRFACFLTLLLLIYFTTGEFGDTLRLSVLYFGLVVPVFVLGESQRRNAAILSGMESCYFAR
jgi:hypothetical protein